MDLRNEQTTSSNTDSHTTGGTPVSTSEAAQANTLFNCRNPNRFPPITLRRTIHSSFYLFFKVKNSARILVAGHNEAEGEKQKVKGRDVGKDKRSKELPVVLARKDQLRTNDHSAT
jgi:hypothetical protein